MMDNTLIDASLVFHRSIDTRAPTSSRALHRQGVYPSPSRVIPRSLPSLVVAFSMAMLATTGTASSAPLYQGARLDRSQLEPFDCTRAGFATPAPSNAVCGWITLPEDSADADNGHTVRIGVAVARATGANPQPDPIVFLQGGPGLSIVESTAAAAQTAFATTIQTRDLVMIDQRGTGLSEPRLDCPEVVSFERAAVARPTDDNQGYDDSVGACIDRLHSQDIDLSTYTSSQSGRDIVAVTRALGYPRINLYGLSYGARLGLTIMRDTDQDGYVRSAALSGVFGPEADAMQVPIGLGQRLDLLFDDCAATVACNTKYGDLRAILRDLLVGLRSRPLPMDVDVAGQKLHALANANTLLDALLDSLQDSTAIAALPSALTALAQGDTSLLGRGVTAELNATTDVAIGANLAILCQEQYLLISPEEQAADAAAVNPAFASAAPRFVQDSFNAPDRCATLGFAAAPASERAPVSGNVPVLTISGRYDPLTPPEWADRATADFGTRYPYVLPFAGHDSALASLCPVAIVEAFFVEPSRAPDTRCIGDVHGPEWVI
jgi:pimeloyl-ACP methyl ester carboxylesterase